MLWMLCSPRHGWKALFLKGYSISQCHSNRKPLSNFSPSLFWPVKERVLQLFTESRRGHSLSLLLFCHLPETWPSFPTATDFVPSCEIQLEEIKTNWARIQVRASIPLTQVIKWNSWLNYMTTDGFTAPSPDLFQIVSEPESSEGIILSHAQTASAWNKTALLWISSPLEQIKTWPQCFFHEMFRESHGHQ